MKQNKFTILLPYYNRPNMVRFALQSLKDQNYDNWQLLFCDDGSPFSGEKVLYEYFPENTNVKYVNTQTTLEEKQKIGSSFGKFLNEFILENPSDICLVICDDDALCKNYLFELNNWYNNNPDKNYSFCNVVPYNPFSIKSLNEVDINSTCVLNYKGQMEINPVCKVDSSQVSWRTNAFTEHGVRYPYPQTSALDASLFQQLYNIFGLCPYNQIVGQYKGFHPEQLGNRRDLNTQDVNFLPS